MKHCNLPFTKCYPLFCILSNFDTSGGEYLHQFVQYSSFLHFKISSRITCVNILCHTHTTCLIIKIWNDKENKLNMIIGNCELGKKGEHSLPEKIGDLLKYTHTTYCLQISCQETQPLMQPTAAATFDKVQVQWIHSQLDHDNFYNKLQKYSNMHFPKTFGYMKNISKEA